MPNYWITTHWPNQEPDASFARHVFFKTGTRSRLPQPGDVVFIYESAYAVVDGKRVFHAYRCQNGRRELEDIPEGRSTIISKVEIAGPPRSIQADNIVRDYGNLGEWTLIPCRNQTKVQQISKAALMEILGYPAKTSPRFLSLWRIPESSIAQRLLERLQGS